MLSLLLLLLLLLPLNTSPFQFTPLSAFSLANGLSPLHALSPLLSTPDSNDSGDRTDSNTVQIGRAKMLGEDMGTDFDDFNDEYDSDAPPGAITDSKEDVDFASSIKDDDLRGFAPQPITGNRFTADEDRTDFSVLSPDEAIVRAREMARMNHNEWKPESVGIEYKRKKFEEQSKYLAGSLKKVDIDPAILLAAAPALKVMGTVADPLSYTDGAWRFHYHGRMVHKRGLEAWLEQLLRECEGVHCTGVWFETGERVRDRSDM